MPLKNLDILLRGIIDRGSNDLETNSVQETSKKGTNVAKSIPGRLLVYGRICTTKDARTPPVNLSDVPGRKTAFLFGPETVYSALLDNIHDPYKMLLRLGFLPEYIYNKAIKLKSCYWLILITLPVGTAQLDVSPSSASPTCSPGLVLSPVPATWDGLRSFLGASYPEALPAVQAHWSLIVSKPVQYFEEKSPVKFITAINNPTGPDFMSYAKFCALPKPQTDWETRLFLYCEVRILELFSGDGHTRSDSGVKGEKEYMSPNYLFERDLGQSNYTIIPLKVEVPLDVMEKYGDKDKR